MIIKGGFHSTTKTQVRKAMRYFDISRSQLEKELVEITEFNFFDENLHTFGDFFG